MRSSDEGSGEYDGPPVCKSFIKITKITQAISPTVFQTFPPTVLPTLSPTVSQTVSPTVSPTVTPTVSQTVFQTVSPPVSQTVSSASASEAIIFRNALAEMQIKIDELTRQGATSEFCEYEFNGTNLIKDIEGKNFIKWSLKCSLHLFSKNELMENCLVRYSRTNKGELDPEGVSLLKSNILFIFKILSKNCIILFIFSIM